MSHGHDTDFSKLVNLCPFKKSSLISTPAYAFASTLAILTFSKVMERHLLAGEGLMISATVGDAQVGYKAQKWRDLKVWRHHAFFFGGVLSHSDAR